MNRRRLCAAIASLPALSPLLALYPPIKGYPHLFVLDAEGALLHSQQTDALEEGESYNVQRFEEFLRRW
ncbi:MAG: hypothetical protein ABI854_08375 [Betaproteobacteria bacterium]